MKKLQFLLFVSVLMSLVLSACGAPAATPAAAGGKVDAMPVAFIGVVDSITGDQWVINGQTVTVAASVVRDGPFQPGDSVKVEGVVNQDGSFTVSRVEVPSPQDVSSLPPFGDDNSNDSNTNDANTNDANINDANMNDANVNDANINEGNVNDDNGNDANLNDDNSNSVNGNDGGGVNSNDDNGNSSSSNDDNGNDSNSNDGDSNGNDDNSGGGSNGGSGSDDNGGNSNDD